VSSSKNSSKLALKLKNWGSKYADCYSLSMVCKFVLKYWFSANEINFKKLMCLELGAALLPSYGYKKI